jgi:hypothetical protein
MRHKMRIALAVTVLALMAASTASPASAFNWFSWRAVPFYLIPL